MVENQGALSWDSQIEKESSFILFPEGDYDFIVDKMERSQYQPSPSAKIKEASPMAELTLRFTSAEHGETNVSENLILHTATEWKISEFFIAIGQKQKGQPFTPNWSQVPGSTGRAKLEINKYTKKDSSKGENNRVVNFLEPAGNTQNQQAQENKGFAF